MVKIYLGEHDGLYNYGSDPECQVSVQEQSYPKSKLFKRFRHTLTQPKPLNGSNIVLCNCKKPEGSECEDDQDCCTSSGKCDKVTIETKDSTGYESAKLQEVHVYYNAYDNNKTPLVLVFMFQNGSPGNKYWKMSEFKDKLGKGESENISTLQEYDEENNLLDTLVGENDQLEEPLTYDIGRIEGDIRGYFAHYYNKGKIQIYEETEVDRERHRRSFKRFTHTPTSSVWSFFGLYWNSDHTNKKACVIYIMNMY